VNVGQVTVKTVGRAMEAGTYGQGVKVRNETTQDIYEVTVTGPQEGTVSPASRTGTSK
jgi:flagella basal body P-ring formation protein FlgA